MRIYVAKDNSPKKQQKHKKISNPEPNDTKNISVEATKTRNAKAVTVCPRGSDGNRLDNNVIASIQQFQAKERRGNIDVW